jgi:hypothetical protein
LLAEAIEAGLAGKPLDETLAGYQRERDAASAEMYRINHEFSKLDPTPELLTQMFAGRPEEAPAGSS